MVSAVSCFLPKTIGQTGGSGFVDDIRSTSKSLQKLAGITGSLSLGVVEISRHRDDRLVYFHSQLFFGPQTQLFQNERRQADGTVKSVVHLDLDQTFGILVYDAIAEMLLFVADVVVGSSPSNV